MSTISKSSLISRLWRGLVLEKATVHSASSSYMLKIVKAMDSTLATFRTKSLKAFGNVAISAPDVCKEKIVYDAVLNRILDPSPSVRDAAVEVVGKLLQSPGCIFWNELYKVVSDRVLVDTFNFFFVSLPLSSFFFFIFYFYFFFFFFFFFHIFYFFFKLFFFFFF